MDEESLGLKRDETTDDFIYRVVVMRPYTGPLVVENPIPVDNGVADCRSLPYIQATNAGEQLEGKGYDVLYPDKPWRVRALERIGLL